MAVMQNSIIFGGIDSADFGIYISGEGVFNAPKRAVEMVEVPGRNGAVAIDQGRWENIEVTYPAFNKEGDLATFAQRLSDFRNALASQIGYQQLSDTFHPNEYRMALFVDGLEIDPVKYNTASKFEIKFDCKPQRWLTSGEIPVTIGEWGATKTASGEIVTIESDGGEAAKSLEVSLEPIQAGSGDPSPTNVRPISGRTEVVTQRTGKNLYEALTSGGRTNSGITWTYNADGSLTASGTATGNSWSYGTAPSVILSSGTYTVSVTSPFSLVIQNVTDGGYFYNGDNSTATFTISKDTTVRIYARVKNGTTINATTGIMLEVGSSASEWQPYNGRTYTTALGRTVYGGTLDVVSGVLTVDRAMVTLNGSETWTASNGPATACMRVQTSTNVGFKPNTSNGSLVGDISSAFVEVTPNKTWDGTIGFSVSTDANPYLHFCQTGQKNMSVEAWKTYLASNPIQVVGLLATPQTYQLTPQQIELLLGENHLWSDGAITLQYGDDPNSLYNPTRYDASPLLAVDGYGTISFNGYDIEITSGDYGDITIASPAEFYTNNFSITIPAEYIKNGDTVTLSGLAIHCDVKFSDSSPYHFYGDGRTTPTPTDSQPTATTRFLYHALPLYGTKSITLITAIPNITFTLGTSETWTNVATVADLQVTEDYGTTLLVKTTLTITDTVAYDATTQTITITQAMTHSPVGDYSSALTYDPFGTSRYPSRIESVVVNSTMTYLGEPTYIDCDLGEAYKIEDGTFISLNSYIDLGSDLPTLASGQNEITIDDTITSLEVIPRWWKL